MALTPSFLRFIIRLHKEVTLEGPVLCLSNHDIWATHNDLRSFFKDMDCTFREVAYIRNTSAGLQQAENWPGSKDLPHAKVFFGMMGIDDYVDIDKYDYDKPMLLHDLNDPIPPSLCNRFSLVVDCGTMEHIFDVKSVFENIVRSLRVGGWVIHFAPSLSTPYLNHGFYGFSPCLFFDFYGTNGFTDFRCYLLEMRTPVQEGVLEPSTYYECSDGSFDGASLDPSKFVTVFFAARKASSLDAIRTPTQGYYDPERRTKAAVPQNLPPNYFERWVARFWKPVPQPLRPFVRRVYYLLFQRKPRLSKKLL